MMMKFYRALALSLLILTRAVAAEPAPTLLSAEVYFQLPTFAAPQISPDGQRLAALTRFDHRHYALAVVDLNTGKSEVLVKEAKVSVTGFGWKSDRLLLVTLVNDDGGHVLQSLDLQTRKANPLHRLNEASAGPVANYLFDDPAFVICPWSDGNLRRVDVRTGRSEQIERTVQGIDRWIIDPAGVAWAGIGYIGEKWVFIWRAEPGAPWQRREQHGIHRATIFPLAVLPAEKRLIVLEQVPGRTARLAYFDLKTATTTELYSHPRVDVTGLKMWGHRWEPAAAAYSTERNSYHAFLPEAAECYRLLADALPDVDCDVISFSRDDQRTIVEARSDRNPGTYYLLERKAGRLAVVGLAFPALPARALVASRSFEYNARDGMALTGIITLPAGVARPPLLVRTGPALVGPRADNTYDSVAQFLASRGIASVRFHTRGTDGFGKDFLRAGDLKITTTVIDDLEDGVAAVTERKWVDGTRVGLLGVAAGGITAVHATGRNRFKVLVNLNTPMTVRHYDVEQLAPSDRDNAELTGILGGSAAANAYIKSLEPIDAVAKVRIPSFHCYPAGEAGHEMAESGRMIKSALAKSGVPCAFHLEPRFKPETDKAKLTGARFEAIAAFLAKHL